MSKATIPNIHCDCGRTIQGWRQVKKGITRVTCSCGKVWQLVKAGRPIRVSRVLESDIEL